MVSRLSPKTRARLRESDVEVQLNRLAELGGWAGVFQKPAEGPEGFLSLTLEIGIGRDAHIVERAAADPERGFVGIEYSRKKLDKVHAKALRAGLLNLRLLHADIFRVLDPVFPDGSLDELFMFFPDPWPKKRHAKNRMVQPYLTGVIARKLKPGSIFELRTDHPDYAEQMVRVLEETEGLANRHGPGVTLNQPDPERISIPTLFELRFQKRGLDLFYLYYERTEATLKLNPPCSLAEIKNLDPLRGQHDLARERREEARED